MCIVYNDLTMNNITHIVAEETEVYLSDVFEEIDRESLDIIPIETEFI